MIRGMERLLMNSKRCCMFAMIALWTTCAVAELPPECGSLDNHYGPFDFRYPPEGSLKKVELAHFDANVARLQQHSKCIRQKARCSPISGDLGYTLEVFPNHHQALIAMAQYQLSPINRKEPPMKFSAECYFQRAIQFTPDDPTVRMIHAYYLTEIGRQTEAAGEYDRALKIAPDSAEVNYNAGLFFLQINDVERATECAVRAYDLGHPLPGLRNKLATKGIDLDSRSP